MRFPVLLLFLAALLSACSNQSRSAADIDVSGEERPSMILREAVYTLSMDKGDPLTVEAGTIILDDRSGRARLSDVTFHREGESLRGSADSVEVNTKTKDATLRGNIVIEKSDDGFILRADTVYWNNEKKTMRTDADEVVTVRFDGTNTIRGRGFRGNAETGIYEFSSIEEGVVKQ